MKSRFSVLVCGRVLAASLVAVCLLSVQKPVSAEDNFDGAIWKFEMTNKKDATKKVIGRFRVSDNVLYQKDTPSDPKYSKKVGTNHPNGKRTRFEVTELRAFKQKSKELIRIKGTGRIALVKFGEWEGLFTDGRGTNWEFKASRIEE